MSGSFLLDTNIVIGLFADDNAIIKNLSAAETVSVPSVVLGELYFGALKSGKPAENISRIDEFAAATSIVACTGATAKVYGSIKHALKTKGRPIPENDIWIAALAIQHSMTLATRDNHFAEVDGLNSISWNC